MNRRRNLPRAQRALALGVILGCSLQGAAAATLESETIARLNEIRAIRAGATAEAYDTYNKQMDAAWQFFGANKAHVMPILTRELKAEVAKDQPSDLVLLDVGFFVHANGDPAAKSVARDALFRVNPGAPIVLANWKELFEFTHATAEERDPRVLALIDRAFLLSDEEVVIAQHALTLDGTLVCVFLYGAYGADAEPVLREKLRDKAVAKRALELLAWLGSPESVPAVGDALSASPNFDTLARVTSFMMQSAGPAGRDFMLALAPDKLDERSRQYLTKVRPSVQGVSVQTLRRPFEGIPGDKHLSDAEVKARLGAMIANFGKDDRTSPLAILDSGLSADFLIAELQKVRSQTLFRLSDEALSDVEVTNALINALRYRSR